MALRYLSRKVGIPALRRASAPRVSPSAGAPPLTSGPYQGGRNNGSRVTRKPLTDADLDRIEAEFEAQREAIYKALSDQKAGIHFVIWCGVAGVGLGALTIGLTVREERTRVRSIRFG